MPESHIPGCETLQLAGFGALWACIEGLDERAEYFMSYLDADHLKALENGAVALSLHASRARKAIEERVEVSGA